jgi:hypothetical protein
VAKARSSAEKEAQAIVETENAQAHAIVERARATVALEVREAKAREPELSQGLAKQVLERALGGGQ